MNFRTQSLAGLAAMALVLTPALAGCGQTAENVAEQLAENAVGGDVDIEDNSVTMTDEEGNQVVIGEGVELPANWPLPVPDSGVLAMATVQSDGTAYAMWQVEGTESDAADSYGDLLVSAGYSLERDSNLDGAIMRDYTGMASFVSVVASESDGQTTISVTDIPE